MQRVLGRTAAAKRQAARRLARQRSKRFKDERLEMLDAVKQHSRAQSQIIKEARLRRSEDWEFGPLAPRRDVGEAAESYGTTDTKLLHQPQLLKKDRTKHWLIREGDRVVVLEGRDQGKIGKVFSTDKESESVTIMGLNMMEIHVPEWMRKEDNDPRTTRVLPGPIPLKNIRLVHAYLDPETLVKRDIIVEEARITQFRGGEHEREIEGLPSSDNSVRWERILWPESQKDEDVEDYDCDTLRITVDEETFMPTLLRPPMPSSVLDELRNKYSKFRDRHDPAYLKQKQEEDLEADARKQIPDWMLQPSRELREKAKNKERLIKPAVPDLMSEDDFLARVGKLMSERALEKEPPDSKA